MRPVFAIAANTWHQFVRDKIFYLTLFVAFLMVGFSYFLATLTIVESRKILLDFGFAALSITGVFIAIFLGIAAVAREIGQRIIYLVVAKPISRSAYLLGKFIGCLAVLAAATALLSLAMAFIVWIGDEALPAGFAACCFLIFLENVIILAFAFLSSIFLSGVLASGLTVTFFLVGRSSLALQTMAESGGASEIRRIAKVFYYIFPNLERFNLRDVVAYGQPYPDHMVPVAVVYASAYALVCLAVAMVLFERRDIP